jgi:hypothetical protein
MKWIKLAIISLIVFGFLLFLLSLLFPSQVFVTRAININAPSVEVLKKISDTSHWSEWNPFAKDDAGRLKIDSIVANGVEYSYLLSSHTEHGNIILSVIDTASCEVRWTQWKRAHYPWEKFSFFYQDKLYAPSFEKGLSRFKDICEQGNK